MTTDVIESVEERAETARDLRLAAQQALGAGDERREWTIEDVSPTRRLYALYNMVDGEKVMVPKFIFDTAINRLIPGTRKFAFTAKKDLAPQPIVSTVKCFKHPDAPEAEILRTLGIVSDCNANGLRNNQSRRIHAQNRHKNSWAAYQEYVTEQERDRQHDIQQKQLDATLALATAAAGTRVAQADPLTCECGWETVKGQNSLAAHKRLHCPLKESTDGT